MGIDQYQRQLNHPKSDLAASQFLGGLQWARTETFESFAPGTSAPLDIFFKGSGTTSLSGAGYVNNVPSGTNGYGRYPVYGNQYWETGSSNFSINFSAPVAAFGFYAVDVGDFAGQISLALTMADGTMQQFVVPSMIGAPGGSILYFGLISPDLSFSSIQFSDTASGVDFFGVDNLTVGSQRQIRSGVSGPVAGVVFLVGLLRRRLRS